VAQDADSIYIQTRNGENYKASLVTFSPQADVAVLKVEDENFRFGSGELPYAFAQRKAGLGARVFTLGFPQDEVVYNEGYISAKNGYGGDSLQYRLELSAQAGQSGAPVLDASGNVVAIVTGREAEVGGPTYAVSTRALLDLLASMPRGLKLNLPKTSRLGRMNREQQIDKLEDYTCIVRVYKK
jgi:S1-C subfamily serine protease